jgi:hypothetical protein
MRLVRGSAHRQHHSTIREAGRAADAGARLPGERPGVGAWLPGESGGARVPRCDCRGKSAGARVQRGRGPWVLRMWEGLRGGGRDHANLVGGADGGEAHRGAGG